MPVNYVENKDLKENIPSCSHNRLKERTGVKAKNIFFVFLLFSFCQEDKARRSKQVESLGLESIHICVN